MLPFTFDNEMKKVGVNFIKTGAMFSILIFSVSLLLFIFNILDFLSVIIIFGLFFLFFYVIGSIFIMQQKHIIFNDTTIEIHSQVKKVPTVIDVHDIEHVSIINAENYQPKIIIKNSQMRHAITCANTVSKQALKSVKNYFETHQVPAVLKNKGT